MTKPHVKPKTSKIRDLLADLTAHNANAEAQNANTIIEAMKQGQSGTFVGISPPEFKREDIKNIDTQVFAPAMTNAGTLPDANIVQPGENFRGRSYGDWLARWKNWLLSGQPYYDGGDVVFLRGNMGYYADPNSFLDMTSFSGSLQKVIYGTAIFVPIITCNWNIGDIYEGKTIQDEELQRRAARDYIYGGGPMWGSIAKIVDNETRELYRLADLTRFYVESPRFKLEVSPASKIRTQLDDPIEPGEYDAVVAAFCVMIKDLQEGTYRIRFGGKGRRLYYTDSVYDIQVIGDQNRAEQMVSVLDISDQRYPDQPLLNKYLLPDDTTHQ